jgi:cytochrome c
LSCHAKAEKIVGPAFVSIADKYKGDKDAAASLAQSIQNGSRGKWGRVPMPVHPSLSQADLKTLAQWVLATKP